MPHFCIDILAEIVYCWNKYIEKDYVEKYTQLICWEVG
jgi:hypothetical protein